MEFICDEPPKNAPIPTPLDQDCVFPSVPEVSMIFSNDNDSTHNQEQPSYMTYDAWKKGTKKYTADSPLPVVENKENVKPPFTNRSETNNEGLSYDNILQLRKRVQFENSVLRQKSCAIETVNMPNTKDSPNGVAQFEQIYMANVPNRNLDLSVIESAPPKSNTINNEILQLGDKSKKFFESSNNSDVAPKTYKEFCARNEAGIKKVDETCSNCRCCQSERRTPALFAPVTSNIDRFSHELNVYTHPKKAYSKTSTDTQTSYIFNDNRLANCNKNTDNEPTVTDLLKIIQQQNEQLLTLQKQVSLLLEKNERPKTIETVSAFKEIGMATENQENFFAEKYVSSTKHETVGACLNTPKKGPLPKFSIDVMTSFNVSIRPQQNFSPRTKHFRDYVNAGPKIQEITENASDKKGVPDGIDSTSSNSIDVSLNLNELPPVHEECPSPVNSIHVEMQDYNSESDTDDDESASEEVEWSLYNNIMHQVENILKNNKTKKTGKDACDANERNNRTMRQVKQVTKRHLKRIGVELSDTDESTDTLITNNSQEYTPTEISFAVKQLLMKYLPDEHLSVLTTQKPPNGKVTKGHHNLIKNRPEFSFATMQYMKKYNLVTQEDQNCNTRKPPSTQKNDLLKILDTTTLKHQPKLL